MDWAKWLLTVYFILFPALLFAGSDDLFGASGLTATLRENFGVKSQKSTNLGAYIAAFSIRNTEGGRHNKEGT